MGAAAASPHHREWERPGRYTPNDRKLSAFLSCFPPSIHVPNFEHELGWSNGHALPRETTFKWYPPPQENLNQIHRQAGKLNGRQHSYWRRCFKARHAVGRTLVVCVACVTWLCFVLMPCALAWVCFLWMKCCSYCNFPCSFVLYHCIIMRHNCFLQYFDVFCCFDICIGFDWDFFVISVQ